MRHFRPVLALLALLAATPALAVPLELSHQGRLVDASGLPLDGTHDVAFALYASPAGGTALWSETLTLAFDDGYFHAVLGASPGNPLDATAFDGSTLHLGVAVDGGAELPQRAAVVSVPFAIRAGSASAVSGGGPVDASSVSVGGVTVIDSSGQIPWSAIKDAPASADPLAALGCGPGEIARVDGDAWNCAPDADHDHDAIDISTGTLEVARLPVGTSSGSVAAGDHAHTAADVGALPITGGALAGSLQLGDDEATCDGDKAGTLRWNGEALDLCNGDAWVVIAGNKGSATWPGRSCKDILDSASSRGDGKYYIDPNGSDPSDAFEVYCDMSTAGGGWTRVAYMAADVPVCSLESAYGTPAQIRDASGTAWLSAAVVSTIDWADREVMLFESGSNYYRYTSVNSGFNWANIANGTINPTNPQSYVIQGARNAEDYTTLTNTSGCTSGAGRCLMGGYHNGANWSLILGIGSYGSGSATQNSTCISTSQSWKGLYGGALSGTWATKGSVYIR